MINSHLDTSIKPYKAKIDRLKETDVSINTEQVLQVLNARNGVQVALKSATFIPTNTLKQVIQLDAELREQAGQITKAIKPEQLAQWRESVHSLVEAW